MKWKGNNIWWAKDFGVNQAKKTSKECLDYKVRTLSYANQRKPREKSDK